MALQSRPLVQVAYESCGPRYGTNPGCTGGTNALGRLDDMASLGFNAVINYNSLSAMPPGSGNLGIDVYISHGLADGIADILNVKQIGPPMLTGATTPYATMAADAFDYPLTVTCVNPQTLAACANNDDYMKYVANLVKGYPGLWGYYVADEPQTGPNGGPWDGCTGDVAAVNQMISDIRTQDTVHPIMIVLGWWYSASQADTTAQVGCFTDSAKKLYVGIDYYPYPGALSSTYSTWLAAAVSANASKGVIGSIEVGQAQSNDPWAPTLVWPGLANMETQKAAFLSANIPNGIYGLYAYFDIISTPTSTDPTTVAQKLSNTETVLRYTGY